MKLQLNTYYTNLLREQLKFNPGSTERGACDAVWSILVQNLGLQEARNLLSRLDQHKTYIQVRSELGLDSLDIS